MWVWAGEATRVPWTARSTRPGEPEREMQALRLSRFHALTASGRTALEKGKGSNRRRTGLKRAGQAEAVVEFFSST